MMCGRFSIAVRIGLIGDRFSVAEPPDIGLPRYNIAPSENVPVITRGDTQFTNEIQMMKWGLIPSWITDMTRSPNPINARAESLAEKPMYRNLLQSGRCIVPATGFYEWRTEGQKKVPWYILMKDCSLFAMAGICDTWRSRDGTEIKSFAIITTSPNDLVAPLHNRMPAILTRSGERKWLDPQGPLTESLPDLLCPCPSEKMQACEVTPAINNPAYKGEESVKKFIRERDYKFPWL